jgi:hypothetical protein
MYTFVIIMHFRVYHTYCNTLIMTSPCQRQLANLLRYIPSQALNFAFKDSFKKVLVPKRGSISQKDSDIKYDFDYATFVLGNLLSGGLAGASSLALLYPLELARTRSNVCFLYVISYINNIKMIKKMRFSYVNVRAIQQYNTPCCTSSCLLCIMCVMLHFYSFVTLLLDWLLILDR